MLKILFWISLTSALFGTARTGKAAPMEEQLEVAQQAWEAQQNGQTEVAIQRYEQVVAEGYASAELYNNLGLAYAKQGNLGKAIVQWERALQKKGWYKEAQHNLAVAQQGIARPIVATQPIAVVRWWQTLHQSWSAAAWSGLFLLLWSLVVAALGYAWYKGRIQWRAQRASQWALMLLVLSFLPLGLAIAQQAQEQQATTAVVIVSEVGLRAQPALSSKEMELLSEGVRVQIIAQEGEWVQVELPNYLVGWLPSSLLERV